ncbi:PAS domain S-box protein [Kocuria tytonicola]|uniref:histidine kinase n=2 Tax=Kocuria tytonicola TaxID=2055946 RepID=A0A3L9L8G0_9MICC|nr:PAS domain S-box protein [Kocuria tytonicola]
MTLQTETGILIHEAVSKNILWANPAACRMFGFSLEELRPLKAHHMSSQEREYRREIGIAWLQEAVVHGTSRRHWKYRNRDGEDFLAEVAAALVNFDDGPVVMVQLRNIGTEVELQEELGWVSESLQRVLTHTSTGIVVLDEDDRIEVISPQAAAFYRQPKNALVGQRLTDLGRCDPALDSARVHDALRNNGDSIQIRQEVVREDGSSAWLLGDLEVVEYDGMFSRVLVMREATARLEWERELAYQSANIQYLSRYNAMGDMAMILAHELGQPLSASANFLVGLKSRASGGAVDGDSLTYGLEQVEKQIHRAAEIVSSVKRYVQRIESTKAPMDVNDTVRESLYFVGLRAAERGVQLRVEFADQELPVEGESVLIGQVVINLCFNAIDEIVLPSTPSKDLTVRTWSEEEWACITVIDEGRGVPEVPGKRLANGAFSNKEDGSGLGLILSEQIIERHSGDLRFLPRHPRGTEAVVRLPLRQAPHPRA